MIVDFIKAYKKLHQEIRKSGILSGISSSKVSDLGVVLSIKKGSHKGGSGDQIVETSEKVAFVEWLS